MERKGGRIEPGTVCRGSWRWFAAILLLLSVVTYCAVTLLAAPRERRGSVDANVPAGPEEGARVAQAVASLRATLSSSRSADGYTIVNGERPPSWLSTASDAMARDVDAAVRRLCELGPEGGAEYAALVDEQRRGGARLALLNAASATNAQALALVLSHTFDPPLDVGEVVAVCDAIAVLNAQGHEESVFAWTFADDPGVRKMAARALAPSAPGLVLGRLVELALFDPDSAVRGNASAVLSPRYLAGVPIDALRQAESDIHASRRGVLELIPPSAWGTVDKRIRAELVRRGEE